MFTLSLMFVSNISSKSSGFEDWMGKNPCAQYTFKKLSEDHDIPMRYVFSDTTISKERHLYRYPTFGRSLIMCAFPCQLLFALYFVINANDNKTCIGPYIIVTYDSLYVHMYLNLINSMF